MSLYTTRISCEIAGRWRVAGDPFDLTLDQAKYLAPPLGNAVVPYTPKIIEKTEQAIGGQHRPERKNRRAAK